MTRVRQRLTGWNRVLVLVGSMGPLGHLPASGTATVGVVGLPLFWFMHDWPWTAYVTAVLAFTGAAFFVHTAGDRILGQTDSRRLVWDELAGFMFAVAFVPFTWQLAAVALVLERAMDIFKIPPANWIEKRCPGGWGVVGDDIVAGLYTCGIIHLLIRFSPSWVGLSPY